MRRAVGRGVHVSRESKCLALCRPPSSCACGRLQRIMAPFPCAGALLLDPFPTALWPVTAAVRTEWTHLPNTTVLGGPQHRALWLVLWPTQKTVPFMKQPFPTLYPPDSTLPHVQGSVAVCEMRSGRSFVIKCPMKPIATESDFQRTCLSYVTFPETLVFVSERLLDASFAR